MTAGVSKPPEVLELYGVCGRVFHVLQNTFDVPATYTFELDDVDRLVGRRVGDQEMAAFAMRGMQVIRSWAAPARPMDGEQFVAVARRATRVLQKLAVAVPDDGRRAVLLEAHERLWYATMAVIDVGGLDPGCCRFD